MVLRDRCMRMNRAPVQAFTFLAFLLAAALAGCFGGGGSDNVAPASSTPLTSSSDPAEAPGLVEGTVVDDSFNLLEGVQIGIQALGLQTTSDAQGKFSFPDVPAGRHQLAAGKLGYEAVARSIEVPAGDTLTLDLVLTPISLVEPYDETFTYEGRITCGILLVPWCGILQEMEEDYGSPNPTEDKFYFNWDWTDGEIPLVQVLELHWTPTSGATGQKLSVLYYTSGPEITDTHTIASADDSTGPIRFYIQQAALESAKTSWPESDFTYGVYPALDEASIDQPFTLYRTDFYGEAPPEDWSIFDEEEEP